MKAVEVVQCVIVSAVIALPFVFYFASMTK